jgi:gamma-glutamyl hydrolase
MLNNFPVIGILSTYSNVINKYMVNYAYVKWLQLHGCYVVYISPTLTKKQMIDLFGQIDGLVIPGGSNHPYENEPLYKQFKFLFDLAMEHGNFPVLGICMGLQYMLTYISNDSWDNVKVVVDNIHSRCINYLVRPIDNTILSNIPIQYFNKPYFSHNHHHAISLQYFKQNQPLMDFFDVLTIIDHPKGNLVSTIQAKKYPFFGFQWHPEKPGFEWSKLQNIHRSPEFIEIGNIVSEFFVAYSRLTRHTTQSSFLKKYNIENLEQYVFNLQKLTYKVYDNAFVVYIV